MNDKINLFDPDTGIKLEVPMDKVKKWDERSELEIKNLAKCREVERLRITIADYQNGAEQNETYIRLHEENQALQSKVTDLEAKVEAYEVALGNIKDIAKSEMGLRIPAILLILDDVALKEQAGEGGCFGLA